MTAQQDVGSDTAHLRRVLGSFASGVSVVTALDGAGDPVGMTIQSFCSLSLDPPLVLLCPGKGSSSWPRIAQRGRLCVNVLAAGQESLAVAFARSGTDKYAGVAWHRAPHTASPVLDGVLAWIDAEVDSVWPGGDHLVVHCRVRAACAHPDLAPLVYFRSAFLGPGAV